MYYFLMDENQYKADDILGTAEVAEVLGVSKQRIHGLRKMAEFPEPFKMLASTPLWDRRDVMTFLSKWKPWKVIDNG
jgi:predicted DNA-binding transcriptional regulator AlpA